MERPKVLVIVGPTASGKSDLAVRLAKKLNGEIISADSRQVYKGLDVGTGKITKKEMTGIPHHLLDVADPQKKFSVSQYKTLAEKALQYIVINSKLPIVVGGAGFYVDALAGTRVFPDVPPNKLLRESLSKLSTEELFRMIQKSDPRRAKAIDPHNRVRLIRALEIVEELGRVPRPKLVASKYEFVYIGLMPEDLDKRIRQRLEKRMPSMIREVKKLIKLKKLSYKRMHELGLEYRYLALYLEGKLSKEEMTEKLYIAIRQYAKRQMTWFKRNKDIKWFKPEDTEGIENYIKNRL